LPDREDRHTEIMVDCYNDSKVLDAFDAYLSDAIDYPFEATLSNVVTTHERQFNPPSEPGARGSALRSLDSLDFILGQPVQSAPEGTGRAI